jgi:hypothetical protein
MTVQQLQDQIGLYMAGLPNNIQKVLGPLVKASPTVAAIVNSR